jgi:apolipoprotein N-acyltransferase
MSHTVPRARTATPRLTWWKLGLAVCAGLLLYLCFPPADLGALAWLALVPLFFALTQVRLAGGFLVGLAFGLCFCGVLASYMLMYGVVSWLVTSVFQGCFFALVGCAAAAANRSRGPALRSLAVAAAWTLGEIVRGSIGGLGFTIGDLGYTQHNQLPLLQAASIVGHYGLGFLMVLLNAALAQAALAVVPGVFLRSLVDPRAFAQRAARNVVAVYAVTFLVYIWGALALRGEATERTGAFSVAAVQGAVEVEDQVGPDDVRRSLDTYLTLSRTIPDDVELVVWPETAVPTALNLRADMMAEIRALAVEKRTHMLVGATEAGDLATGEIFNTLYFISPQGEELGLYRKVILVPFGEYVPKRERFPFLAKFAVRKFDFSPGDRRRVFAVGDLRVGPLICFEALFPHAVRDLTRMGAELIVLATSDEWAAHTAEVAQHSYTAPLRAVESRRYVVRAATWGVSAIISPYGRVIADVPLFQPGVAWADVHQREALSTYHRIGDVPLIALCALLWLLAVLTPSRPADGGKE